MTITLITPEEHSRLIAISEEHPILIFNNVGHQYVDKRKFSEADWLAFNEVTELLKKTIKGFKVFNNFKTNNRTQELVVRFQYDWTADNDPTDRQNPFTGVGYLYVDELLNGFRNKEKQE
jgi:hypothetical protein